MECVRINKAVGGITVDWILMDPLVPLGIIFNRALYDSWDVNRYITYINSFVSFDLQGM